mmetsp:Transcript_14741/g.35019  ORF Transcript_14741/g.35019 Transcript_14741/m.35019 type:complete len:207 (+) Transcript_14741:2-622(+)
MDTGLVPVLFLLQLIFLLSIFPFVFSVQPSTSLFAAGTVVFVRGDRGMFQHLCLAASHVSLALLVRFAPRALRVASRRPLELLRLAACPVEEPLHLLAVFVGGPVCPRAFVDALPAFIALVRVKLSAPPARALSAQLFYLPLRLPLGLGNFALFVLADLIQARLHEGCLLGLLLSLSERGLDVGVSFLLHFLRAVNQVLCDLFALL